MVMTLTPSTVNGSPNSNPLKFALQSATIGEEVICMPGVYPPPGAVTAAKPSVIRCFDPARRWELATGDGMGLFSPTACDDIIFREAIFRGNSQACVMFWAADSDPATTFDNITFQDCTFLGQNITKWGIHPIDCSNLIFRRCRFKDFIEHGIYDHSPNGPRLLEDISIENTGRSGYQVVGRVFESDFLPAMGLLKIVRGTIKNNGALDGGSALSIANHSGNVEVTDLKIELNTLNGSAIVLWAEEGNPNDPVSPKPGIPNGIVTLNNVIATSVGSNRQLCLMSDCDTLVINGGTYSSIGGNPHTWELNPIYKSGHKHYIGYTTTAPPSMDGVVNTIAAVSASKLLIGSISGLNPVTFKGAIRVDNNPVVPYGDYVF